MSSAYNKTCILCGIEAIEHNEVIMFARARVSHIRDPRYWTGNKAELTRGNKGPKGLICWKCWSDKIEPKKTKKKELLEDCQDLEVD